MLASFDAMKTDCHLAAYTILRGNFDSKDLTKSIIKVREKNLINFIPWGPAALYINPVDNNDGEREIFGLSISNHTSVAQILKKIIEQYDRLRKRNAFLDMYRRETMFADNLDEFDSAR